MPLRNLFHNVIAKLWKYFKNVTITLWRRLYRMIFWSPFNNKNNFVTETLCATLVGMNNISVVFLHCWLCFILLIPPVFLKRILQPTYSFYSLCHLYCFCWFFLLPRQQRLSYLVFEENLNHLINEGKNVFKLWTRNVYLTWLYVKCILVFSLSWCIEN